jgi:hypothetical protein
MADHHRQPRPSPSAFSRVRPRPSLRLRKGAPPRRRRGRMDWAGAEHLLCRGLAGDEAAEFEDLSHGDREVPALPAGNRASSPCESPAGDSTSSATCRRASGHIADQGTRRRPWLSSVRVRVSSSQFPEETTTPGAGANSPKPSCFGLVPTSPKKWHPGRRGDPSSRMGRSWKRTSPRGALSAATGSGSRLATVGADSLSSVNRQDVNPFAAIRSKPGAAPSLEEHSAPVIRPSATTSGQVAAVNRRRDRAGWR